MNDQIVIKVIMISGRSGSGKTSVTSELYARFSMLSIPHVRLEGDSLDEMYPEENDAEVFLTNLSSMWQNFTRLRGCTRLLINGTAVVLEAEELCETLQQASKEVNGSETPIRVEMRAFVLCNSNAVAQERLSRRETDRTLERHLQSSSKMAKVLGELQGDELEFIPTDDRSVSQVTDKIVESCLDWFQE